MNLAKSMLAAILALPVAELVVFVLVAAAIGFGPAVLLILASSLLGGLVLRHAGGRHIERIRVAMGSGSFTSLRADGTGSLTLLAGILLLIPGFITSVIGLLLLIAPLQRLFGGTTNAPGPRADGVVDLAPEQWHQVPDAALTDRRDDERER
ncbi:MAG TPA: FxsA family protein [Pseudolabrys sp.]|nr:FxsA family protein [Pseudolabrys sp.]